MTPPRICPIASGQRLSSFFFPSLVFVMGVPHHKLGVALGLLREDMLALLALGCCEAADGGAKSAGCDPGCHCCGCGGGRYLFVRIVVVGKGGFGLVRGARRRADSAMEVELTSHTIASGAQKNDDKGPDWRTLPRAVGRDYISGSPIVRPNLTETQLSLMQV